MIAHRRLEPAAVPGSPSSRGPHPQTCGVAPNGITLGSIRGQSTQNRLQAMWLQSNGFRVYGAGGTGIEPATCGFGARGALSRVIQARLNCPGIGRSWRRIVQRRPSTSSRSVVSFVVSATCTRVQGEGRHTNLDTLISPGHLKATSYSNFIWMHFREQVIATEAT
jgi:hypothetical protein